jgi:hypothetical protein
LITAAVRGTPFFMRIFRGWNWIWIGFFAGRSWNRVGNQAYIKELRDFQDASKFSIPPDIGGFLSGNFLLKIKNLTDRRREMLFFIEI